MRFACTSCGQDTDSQHTSVQYSLFKSAERTPRAWLKAQELHNIFVRLERICHLVCTCLILCCSLTCRSLRAPHLPNSLFLPPRYKNTQHNQDNTIYSKNTQYIINPLQAFPVDKQRHQESLWRENLQSGGNPHTTTPTGYEPKELVTVSRTEDYPGDPDQLYDAQKEFGEETHRARPPTK